MSSSEVLTAALSWHTAGFQVFPAKLDRTKAPAGNWRDAIHHRMEITDVLAGFAGNVGVGLICGQISGGLEMTEFEGRAIEEGLYDRAVELMDAAGLTDLWDRITTGYTEATPSGGMHILYRVTGMEVPGNTKIARRPTTAEERETNPDEKLKVLVETRGEGGFVIIAPTPGEGHPSGKPWEVTVGDQSTVPTLTAEERNELIRVLKALDQMPQAEPVHHVPAPRAANQGLTPGDDFAAKTTWAQILEPEGWKHVYRSGDTDYWRRPGKDIGLSASTNHKGSDVLWVWSSSTTFDPETSYTKLGAYAHVRYGSASPGALSDAARDLAAQGFGDNDAPPAIAPIKFTPTRRAPSDQTIGALRVKWASTIPMRRTTWLYDRQIPLGEITILAGKGGVGKSQTALDTIAKVTRGELEGEFEGTPRKVLIVATEDSWESTIAPRLYAADANLDLVAAISAEDTGDAVVFDLAVHGNDILSAAREHEVAMVFFDPLVSAMPGRKRNDGDHVRPAMEHLSRLAKEGNFAAFGLMHLRKDLASGDLASAIGGSSEWTNVARAAYVSVADPEEEGLYVMSLVKHNLGPAAPSMMYSIETVEFDWEEESISTSRVVWKGISDRSADDLVRDTIDVGGADRTSCRTWLKEWMPEQGAVNYQRVLEEAELVGGWSKSTVYRAGKEVGVRSSRLGFGGQTVWSYP